MKKSKKDKLFEKSFKESIIKDLEFLKEDELEKGLSRDLGKDNASPNQAEFENNMEKSIDSIDTEVYNQEEKKLQNHIKQRTEENNELLAEWIKNINDFIDFLNNPQNPGSIKSITNNAMPGSTLEKIKKTESRRLTRVSTEAAALSQALNSYIGAGNEIE